MSSFEFEIGDWVQADDPDQRRASTSAELVVLIDHIPATRLLDTWARTVRDRARLPLYPLAEWLAANWWRLHSEAPYEGGGQPPTDWRLSHDMVAIGGGFIWPRIRIASDDLTIQISARAFRNASWEPVRYLNDVLPARAVQLVDFDRAAEHLIDQVLLRMRDLNVSAEPLATIWSDVIAERSDPEVAEWRRWEARLGYDPDEAPEHLMKQLAGLFEKAGKSAAAEVAPLLSPRAPKMLNRLRAIAESPGVEATLPTRVTGSQITPDVTPWDAARETARRLRGQLAQKTGPLENKVLLDLLGASAGAFDRMAPLDLPIGLGVVGSGQQSSILHFRRRNLPGLRFEAARFVAEGLSAPEDDLWLPLTDRATARQKFQRAFAVELLAPIKEIVEQVGDDLTLDRFEDVADRYGVSPLAIRSHLANHGLLNQEQVAI